MPDYDLEPCKACGSVVVHKQISTERKGLCQPCWNDPLKRAAALFGEDPEEDPPGLPYADQPPVAQPGGPPPGTRPRSPQGARPAPGAAGMTGMYVLAAVYAPAWLMDQAARKLLGWAPLGT
jgi:hypothetical protein